MIWLHLLWPALLVIAVVVGAQIWLDRRGSKVAGWHWLWGAILGILMASTVVHIQAGAERHSLVSREQGEFGDAYAVVIIVLLCIIIFKRPAETVHRDIRVVRPGTELEDQ
ncbi:hypothetical protein AMK68_03665 [candidate division KD3-62 bacterium DG_56]|uniref:Uncharacterized protein n=1 Tax=candidate division KD3-62 bacterium DG_56 TaxID=1704032 RepID=A0A0S7XMA3_9BACT|nr:MAG: hypothetical protein AMK68_03665 [candidate division KD3-62 bacterium DG_56]